METARSDETAEGANAAAFRLGIFVGGVQKAATTTIHAYFCAHPQLLAPTRKETHFFDAENRDWSAPDYATLRNLYPTDSTGRRPFDITPVYLFWPGALARLNAYNPEARLVFLFRDPIERAWSHWRMEMARADRAKLPESLPFSRAIREGRQRLRPETPKDEAWRCFSYVERGLYAGQLQRLLSIFPRRQVLLLRSADLARNHELVLTEIAAFLGLDPFPTLPARHDHRSADDGARLDPQDVAYLRDIFRDDVRAFSALSGLNVDDWLTMREA